MTAIESTLPDHTEHDLVKVANAAKTVHARIASLCEAANTPGADYFDASTNMMLATRDLLMVMGFPYSIDTSIAAARSHYPECSGDSSSCPENEGFGCCKEDPVAANSEPMCATCGGNGEVTAQQRVGESEFEEWQETCPVCDGAGNAPKHVQELQERYEKVSRELHALKVEIGGKELFASLTPQVSTNQPAQAKAMTDMEILEKSLKFAGHTLVEEGEYAFSDVELLAFARALLASQPSEQPNSNEYAWRLSGEQWKLCSKDDFLGNLWSMGIGFPYECAARKSDGTGILYREGKPSDLLTAEQWQGMFGAAPQPSAQTDVAAVRDAALEEAALACEIYAHGAKADNFMDCAAGGRDCAKQVRALKSAAPTAQPQADGVQSCP